MGKNGNGKMKVTRLDRAIGYLSPQMLVNRLKAREFSYRFYEGTFPSRARSFIPIRGVDAKDTATSWDRTVLLSHARYLEANLGVVRGVVGDMMRYTCPLRPQCLSEDRAWADAAEDYFDNWSKIADATNRFTFWDLQKLAVRCLIVDGDCGFVMTTTSEDYPRLQLVESHQFGGHDVARNLVDGVFLDGFGNPVSYRLVKRENGNEIETLVAARDFIHFFEPDRYTACRGISHFAAAVNNLRDIFEVLALEKIAIKNNSAVSLIETNDSGTADLGKSYLDGGLGLDANAASGGIDTQMEMREGGEIRYIRAGSGGGLKPFQFERPGTNFLTMLDYLESDGYCSLGMPSNWKNLHKEGGATLRAALMKAQRRFDELEFLLETHLCNRVFGWVVAKASKRGELPPLPADYWRLRWQCPSKVIVDVGREAQQNREDTKMGMRTLAEDYGERGLDWETALDQIAREQAMIAELAKKYGVPKEDIQLRVANPAQAPAEPQTTEGK